MVQGEGQTEGGRDITGQGGWREGISGPGEGGIGTGLRFILFALVLRNISDLRQI